ncbi:MAG: hypothetical protein NTZ01_01075, partial [Verrucomicrobia bacterium]|nr:hypothetical protein [Verrucomicrobiota bacterium]
MNTKAIWKKRAGLRSWVNYFLIMVICDAVFLAVAFAGFHIFRRGEIPTFWPVQAYVISFGFCGLALYVAGAYSIRIDKLSLEYATGHLVAFFIILPILLSVIYVFSVYTDNYKPARGVVIPGVATLALVSLGLRRAMESRVTHRRRGRYYAIIGNAHDIRSLWHELLERPKQKPLTPRFFDVIDGQV